MKQDGAASAQAPGPPSAPRSAPQPVQQPAPATVPRHVLPVIIAAQFAGTSLWLAGNAVVDDLRLHYGLPDAALGGLTSAVQLGFIVGTLLYAVASIADRFSPSKVFLVSALLGAACNVAIVAGPDWAGDVGLSDYTGILLLRFATGFFLAGIYPVGMKIASDWYAAGLGKALGFLVGALVLGTAFPHLVRASAGELSWQAVLIATSAIAALGGLAVSWFVPDGPYRKPGVGFRPGAIVAAFGVPRFRSAAMGYFGHMWELYGFWAFVPLALATRMANAAGETVSLAAFVVIAMGSLGCVVGGFTAMRVGSASVASVMMVVSGVLCLASPLVFALPLPLFLALVCLWGFAVVGDSPQFSTLVARYAVPELRGSALTIVNSIGFAITIPSIQLLTTLSGRMPVPWIYLALAIGPVLGWMAMRPLVGEGA